MEEINKLENSLIARLQKDHDDLYWNRSLTFKQFKQIFDGVDMAEKWIEFEKAANQLLELSFVDDELPVCSTCGVVTTPIFDNVGYTAPDPVRIEVVGYRCSNCGNYQKDAEFMAEQAELAKDYE